MAAESVIELPFHNEEVVHQSPGLHLEIDPGSHQRTEVYHGSARVSRMVSAQYTFEMPLDHVSSDVVDVHLNGITATGALQGPVRKAGAQLGKMGISLDTGRSFLSSLSPRDLLNPEKFRQEGVNAVLDDAQERFGLQLRFRFKSHSTGLRTGIATAEAAPERVDSITSVGGAALDGVALVDYVERLQGFVEDEVITDHDILRQNFANVPTALGFLWYNFGMLNLPRTLVEAYSIANDDVRARFINLGDQGIKLAILDGLADRLTPNKSVPDGIGRLVNVHRIHPVATIGHLGPQTYPLEMAMEYHSIDEELHPDEVIAPRRFAVRALTRGIETRRPELGVGLAKVSGL